MVVLIPSRRVDGTLVFKACVYGPSESGRKTVIEWLYGKEELASGKLNEIKDEKGSMLFFDRKLGNVSNVIFQVYTFDVSDESNARMFLKGADSILFIWDSLIEKWGNNISSLKTLLRFYGDKLIPRNPDEPSEVPTVFLANKRDLEDIVEISKIRQVLDTAKMDQTLIYETIAITGVNVKRAFVYAARQAFLIHYKKLSEKSKEKKTKKDAEIHECVYTSEKCPVCGEIFENIPKLERELKYEISLIDLIIEEYKRFPSKKITDMIETLGELLNIYIEKFEASKTGMNLFHFMQEASKYATKETNNVISYQKYQILLGTLISKLKTLIPLLKERLEELKI